ncbi:uncharacterized protein BDW43DRAFT_283734 [Aspergillus alliaceus]|uniref:uncharacterized protein n=1 Tax=Petromyces alliaceus TaxID=209559 RepID=UPI0012A43757|nr:uncharacterized protein BDW43DRAFT_283734 [Aspergillus alliaceus]KAB8230920.1 hypothetical protein BDW43DRAFT_283734 [Aspergillus alliaceus]
MIELWVRFIGPTFLINGVFWCSTLLNMYNLYLRFYPEFCYSGTLRESNQKLWHRRIWMFYFRKWAADNDFTGTLTFVTVPLMDVTANILNNATAVHSSPGRLQGNSTYFV